MKDKTILIISPEPWGPAHVSKHHYAKYLSKTNRVFFLNPPVGSEVAVFGKMHPPLKKVNDSLTVISYKNIFPKLTSLPKSFQKIMYSLQAKKLMAAIGVRRFDIVWTFDPYRFWNQKVWNAGKYIYHIVDVHALAEYETDMLESSDVRIAVSSYFSTNKKFNRHQLAIIPHGFDADSAEQAKPVTDWPITNGKPVAGVITNFLTNNFDYESITEAVLKFHDSCNFVFIGPIHPSNLGESNDPQILLKLKALQKLKNAYFLGIRDSEDLFSYADKFDISLVVYNENAKNSFPHKLMLYLGTGKLIVSTCFPDKHLFVGDTLLTIENNQTLSDVLQMVLEKLPYYNSLELVNRRKQLALDYSYDKNIDRIENLVYSDSTSDRTVS